MISKQLLCFVSITLTVLEVSSGFVKEPARETIGYSGSSVTFDWQLAVTDVAEYRKWSHGNQTIVSVQRLNDTSDAASKILATFVGRVTYTPRQTGLTITDLGLPDEGIIKCSASLTDGNVFMSETFLRIVVKPTFTTTLVPELTVLESENTTLTCAVDSRPAANITWYKNDVEILLDNRIDVNVQTTNNNVVKTTSNLVLTKVHRSDRGTYKCTVRYEFGEEQRTTSLSVYYPATITSFPPAEYGTVEHARNVKIICNVYGNPLPTVRWFINDKLVENPNSEFTITNTTKINKETEEEYKFSELSLTSVEKSDFGQYTCEATNNVPGQGVSVTNKTTTLVVSHKPYFLKSPDQFFTTNVSSSFIFNCTVQSHVTPTVAWSTEVTTDDRFIFHPVTKLLDVTGKIIVQAMLEVKNVRKTDHGIYRCTANDKNSTVTTNTTLLIQYPPELVTGPPSEQVLAEFSVQYLECVVNSYPRASIEWFYAADRKTFKNISHLAKEELLATASYEMKVQSRINFNPKISRNDEGIYYCVVNNSLGSFTKQTNVTVHWPAEFDTGTIDGGSTVIKILQSASFNCIARSKPEPTIKWIKDDLNEVNSDTASFVMNTLFANSTTIVKESILTFTNATASDTGLYTCVVENTVASVKETRRRKKYLDVMYPPIVLAASTNQTIEITNSLTLSCASQSNPPINRYLWKKDGTTKPNNQSEYIIGFVDRDTKGVYTCTPENAEGVGNTVTHRIAVKITPAFTSKASCQEEDGTYHCYCAGVGYPAPQVTWVLRPNNVSQTTGNSLNLTIGTSTVGIYSCILQNSHGSVTSDITLLPPYTDWTAWSNCNVTCGGGSRTRDRRCNYNVCNNETRSIESCNAGACPIAGQISSDSWHKDWYIALWLMIPVFVVLCVVCVLWMARKNRKGSKPVFVPINRDVSQPPSIRSIPTQRDIYLPEPTELSAVNNGSIKEERPPKKQETDTIEVEMYFGEEEVARPSSSSQQPPSTEYAQPGPSTAKSNAYTEFDDDDESFRDTDFNYLDNSNGFLKLYDRAGPPKSVRDTISPNTRGHDNKAFSSEETNGYV
ncbi:hemicentin-1-like isoform X2 [Hydractinia symbiolongicarpus]|uniref:hemicentin-1-like isoform X2 n=1 Tax=Hydractinia symbiolongicarpus TaxID=13093 RepID=UPI00254C57E0|nr:hemicentin-1-like isoform X2 [Hydractinia symbiolongicarpus]